jgi:hypothetical protein
MGNMDLNVIDHSTGNVIKVKSMAGQKNIHPGQMQVVCFASDILESQPPTANVFDFPHLGIIAAESGEGFVMG